MDWISDLISKSKIIGHFYTKQLDDHFSNGDLVTVYSHYSYRVFTINKNNKPFRIHHTDFGAIFFTKDEWRDMKINCIFVK
jgi:hypothetical protein